MSSAAFLPERQNSCLHISNFVRDCSDSFSWGFNLNLARPFRNIISDRTTALVLPAVVALGNAIYKPLFNLRYLGVITQVTFINSLVSEVVFRGVLEPVLKKVIQVVISFFSNDRMYQENTATTVSRLAVSIFAGLTLVATMAETTLLNGVILLGVLSYYHFALSTIAEQGGIAGSYGFQVGFRMRVMAFATIVIGVFMIGKSPFDAITPNPLGIRG